MTNMTTNMTKLAESLVDNLPTREDVINAIGLASRRSTTTDFASMIGVFGAGLLIGAGLALLFAPKSGEELRRELGERMSSSESETSPSSMNRGVTGATSFHTQSASGL